MAHDGHRVIEPFGRLFHGEQRVLVGTRAGRGRDCINILLASASSSPMAGSTCSARMRSNGI